MKSRDFSLEDICNIDSYVFCDLFYLCYFLMSYLFSSICTYDYVWHSNEFSYSKCPVLNNFQLNGHPNPHMKHKFVFRTLRSDLFIALIIIAA